MGRMSYIHYLCEKQDEDGLIEETGSETLAKHFLEAHLHMRENRNTDEFKALNEMADESIKEYKKDPQKAKLEGKNASVAIMNMVADIQKPN